MGEKLISLHIIKLLLIHNVDNIVEKTLFVFYKGFFLS